VFRRFAHAIGLVFALVLGLAPELALAQTNIDQGKSPAEIFANDCATCHKSPRGLASGQGSASLAGFLVEHYTSGRDQAAALAAYVMGAGGGDRVPATQGRGPKVVPTAGEETKPTRPVRPAGKPDEGAPATAKLQPPAGEETKRPPGDVPSIIQEPGAAGRKPAAGRREVPPATATRGRRKDQESTPPPAQEPAAAVVASPNTTEPPAQEASPAPGPSAAVPANSDSGESAPVPRDNIPD
jgi:hypothetical protein